MTAEDIARHVEESSLVWTTHIFDRLRERGIRADDVETALLNCEIIESYPNDYPFSSCLILGSDTKGQALHVVCASDGVELRLITAYSPSIFEWTEDFKQRRKV